MVTRDHYIADVAAVRAAAPGWKVSIEAAGADYSWIPTLGVDYIVTWEGAVGDYNAYQACDDNPPDSGKFECHTSSPPSWWTDTNRTINIVCAYQPNGAGVPSNLGSVKDVFTAAWAKGAGYLYLTDHNFKNPKLGCGGPLGVPPPEPGSGSTLSWTDEVSAAK